MIRLTTTILALIISITSMSVLSSQECFVFESLDKATIELWLSARNNSPSVETKLKDLKTSWETHKQLILEYKKEIPELPDLIPTQDDRLISMQSCLDKKKIDDVINESFMFMIEFSELRRCYCNSSYILDELIRTQHSYMAIHHIIHDELLGLYEWNEFIWLKNRFKEQVYVLDMAVFEYNGINGTTDFANQLDKIKECLNNLEQSIEEADRQVIEDPCFQMNLAIEDIFKEFVSIKRHMN